MSQLNNPKDVSLNEKETQILKLICEDMTTKEIALQMELSPRTVETLKINLKEKCRVRTYPALVVFAVRSGLVSIFPN